MLAILQKDIITKGCGSLQAIMMQLSINDIK